MAETQYRNSKGEWVDIAAMPYPHLKNAAEKLRRTGDQPAALETMDRTLALLERAYREEQERLASDITLTEEERNKARAELARLGG